MMPDDVAALRQALAAAVTDDRTALEANLANALRARFEVDGDPIDIDEAAPSDPAVRVVVLGDLALALRVRFQATSQPPDIDEAIETGHRAVAVRPGIPDHALALLEQDRGRLISQAIDARSDLADVSAAAPELAARLTELRRDLDEPATDRRAAAAGFDEVVARSAPCPGWTDSSARRRCPRCCAWPSPARSPWSTSAT